MNVEIFSIKKHNNGIVLFSVKSEDLKFGEIFFKRDSNGNRYTLQDHDIDSEYVNTLVDGLTEDVMYKFEILKPKN
jgi:hypothetical protein